MVTNAKYERIRWQRLELSSFNKIQMKGGKFKMT
jgi:hypothetical protein